MCGRFTRKYTWKQLHALLSLSNVGATLSFDHARLDESHLNPRYNVAPTQHAPIVRLDTEGKPSIALARWGLVPGWAQDLSIGNRAINARADGITQKPMFRSAFKSRRCLVPISGFYEWQVISGQKVKQPWYIFPADEKPMCLAGLWECWGEKGAEVETFTIITTEPNEFMRRLHDRMPVILQPEQYERWLNPATPTDELVAMFAPAPDGFLDAYPVSTRVNKPGSDEPALLERVSTSFFGG